MPFVQGQVAQKQILVRVGRGRFDVRPGVDIRNLQLVDPERALAIGIKPEIEIPHDRIFGLAAHRQVDVRRFQAIGKNTGRVILFGGGVAFGTGAFAGSSTAVTLRTSTFFKKSDVP